jgi:hypothetical protein
MEWIEYVAEGDSHIPADMWGRDHWTTLLYLETRAVDHGGNIDNKHMRCNARLHRPFYPFFIVEQREYPTRLANGEVAEAHDDWCCAYDMVAAGMIKLGWKRVNTMAMGNSVAKVELTDLGWQVVSQLRRHKAEGKNSAQFRWAPQEQLA